MTLSQKGFAPINGLEFYYEVHGSGEPLVMLHGGIGATEMLGPNLELLEQVCAVTDAPVIASGGVSTVADLVAIATLTDKGVEGSIVGKALYAGRFTLPEALAAVADSAPSAT